MTRQGALGANVRYREDTGWEMRCDECPQSISHWWPLTFEFWDPPYTVAATGGRAGRSMTRCRACWTKRDARTRREAMRRNPEAAERARQRHIAYGRANRDVLTMKQRLRRAEKAA